MERLGRAGPRGSLARAAPAALGRRCTSQASLILTGYCCLSKALVIAVHIRDILFSGPSATRAGQVVPGRYRSRVREGSAGTRPRATSPPTRAGVYRTVPVVPGDLRGRGSGCRDSRPGSAAAIVLQVTDRVQRRRPWRSRWARSTRPPTAVRLKRASSCAPTPRRPAPSIIEQVAVEELPLNGRNFATARCTAPGITPGGQAGARDTLRREHLQPRGASGFDALGRAGQLQRLADRQASTATSSRSTPSSSRRRSSRCASSRCSSACSRRSSAAAPASSSVSTKVGHQSAARHRRSSSCATTPSTRATSSSARSWQPDGIAGQGSGAAARPAPVRRRARRRAGDPGLYDGHSRTFFFADYAGIKRAARRHDGQYRARRAAAAHRRLQQLPRSQRQPDSDLRSAHHAPRRGEGRIVRDQFPEQHHSRRTAFFRSAATSRASIRCRTTAAATSTTTSRRPIGRSPTTRSPGRVDHRLSDSDSFFVRFNYGRFRLDAPQGQANCCLPTPAGGRGPIRSRARSSPASRTRS